MKNIYYFLFSLGFISGLGTGYFFLMRHFKLKISEYSQEVNRVENPTIHSQMVIDAYERIFTEVDPGPCNEIVGRNRAS